MAAYQLIDSPNILYRCDVCGATQEAYTDAVCVIRHGWHVAGRHAFCPACKSEPCDVCE